MIPEAPSTISDEQQPHHSNVTQARIAEIFGIGIEPEQPRTGKVGNARFVPGRTSMEDVWESGRAVQSYLHNLHQGYQHLETVEEIANFFWEESKGKTRGISGISRVLVSQQIWSFFASFLKLSEHHFFLVHETLGRKRGDPVKVSENEELKRKYEENIGTINSFLGGDLGDQIIQKINAQVNPLPLLSRDVATFTPVEIVQAGHAFKYKLRVKSGKNNYSVDIYITTSDYLIIEVKSKPKIQFDYESEL